MFAFDFEDLWDEQLEEALIGSWAYIGRQGRTTYSVKRSEQGQLLFEGPSATGTLLSGVLQPVKDRTLEAVLREKGGETAGSIRLSVPQEKKAVVSSFRPWGKEKWGQEIVSHRLEPAAIEKEVIQKVQEPVVPKDQGNFVPQKKPAPVENRRPWWEDAMQNPVIHEVKSVSQSPYMSQVGDLSREAFGINVLAGLDAALKGGDTRFSVMAKGSSLVGFVLYSKDEKKGELRLHYLAVHGSFRGHGAGVGLLKHMQEKCVAAGMGRLTATCRYDQLFYFLRVGFYFSVQPPPDLSNPSAEVTQRLHHVRFGVDHELGRPASQLLGRPPAKSPLPATSGAWSDLEKEFFQKTHGKYVVEEVAKLRQEPGRERASIVIPTMEKRQEFHEQFCACFEAQDFPDTELVVVETYQRFASPAVAALARRLGKRVIHVKFQTELTIGLKRNMGLHLATGQYIVHFDDDDLYAPNYVSHMVSNLKMRGLKALTLCSWYNCTTHSGNISYTCPVDGTWGYEGIVYGFGFSYVYHRAVAMEHPFPHVNMSEDNQFMSKLRRTFGDGKVGLLHDKEGICMHLLHGKNSSSCDSNRDVSLEEAAGLKVLGLHKVSKHVESKGMTAIRWLYWAHKGLDKEEARMVLSGLRAFLLLPHVKRQIAMWTAKLQPADLDKRVKDMLWKEAWPELFSKMGLPADGGLQVVLQSLENRYREDEEIVAAWRDVHQLQGNEEAAEKITRHLVALRAR